jgi:hypothetical protein
MATTNTTNGKDSTMSQTTTTNARRIENTNSLLQAFAAAHASLSDEGDCWAVCVARALAGDDEDAYAGAMDLSTDCSAMIADIKVFYCNNWYDAQLVISDTDGGVQACIYFAEPDRLGVHGAYLNRPRSTPSNPQGAVEWALGMLLRIPTYVHWNGLMADNWDGLAY